MPASENLRLHLAAAGDLDSLGLVPCARRDPGPGEVEIEVEATALNFKDVLLALGVIPSTGREPPVFGFECSGRVVRIGADVPGVAVGDDVVTLATGCTASYVTVPATTVQPRPHGLSMVEAVTFPVAFVTAEYALYDLGRLRRGERVLIQAAAGGVGLAAVQLAYLVGAEVYASAGNDEKRAYLRSLGAAHVTDSRSDRFAEEILSLTGGRGVDVVLNSLSGALLEKGLSVLAPHGRFVELGARDMLEAHTVNLAAFARGASFCAVGFAAPIPDLPRRLAATFERVERHQIVPLPHTVFPVAAIGEAFTFLARARHIGKVVVAWRNDESAVHRGNGQAAAALTGPAPAGAAALGNYLLPSEGVEVLDRILAARMPQVVVSTTDLATRLSGPLAGTGTTSVPAPIPSSPPAPADDAEAVVLDVFRELLGVPGVAPDDDFFELGGDSLMAVQVIHKLRNALGVDVPTHSLIEHPTGAELARFLAGRTADGPDATADDAHLVRLSAGEPGHRAVFLVHPVGGSVYIYRDLARSLGPGATVYGLQAQGVDGSRPPLARVEDMAGQYIAAIRLVQPQGPYVLGGSSFGGLVAFEMAQQLLGAGEDVEVVVMIDTAGPGDDFRALSDDAEILAYLLGHGDMDTDAVERLRRLPSEEQLEVFIRQGGAAERLSEAASVDDVRHFLSLFRANFQSLVQYQPRPYPGRVLFFRAAEADAVNPSDPDRSWRGIVQGGLDVVSVPGNHITMNLSPNVEAIGRRLQACLAEINQE